MKTGWEKVTIGKLGRVVTGKTPPTVHKEYYGGPYPFITPSDMEYDGRNIETERTISEEGFEYQRQLILPPKTTCFVCIGATIGKICLTKTDSFTNQQINSIVADKDYYDNDFIYYLLGTQESKVKSIAGGAATPIVSKSSFSSVEVIAPKLHEQKSIACILSAYDDLIENSAQRIKILEEMARLIYREWFVEFKAPGIKLRKATPEEKKVTRKDRFPEGWELKRLDEVAGINIQSIDKSSVPDIIQYVDISSVSTGTIDSYQNYSFKDAPGRARRKVRHGDILWSCVRPNRKAYSLILHPSDDVIVSTGFAVITPTIVPYTYLYETITTESFVSYLVNHARGAAYPAVTQEDFQNAQIIIPAIDLLNKYHHLVEPLEELRHSLKISNTNLRQTRDLLLPKLISGEVEV
jgi:type I restriction enzyme, S subunit